MELGLAMTSRNAEPTPCSRDQHDDQPHLEHGSQQRVERKSGWKGSLAFWRSFFFSSVWKEKRNRPDARDMSLYLTRERQRMRRTATIWEVRFCWMKMLFLRHQTSSIKRRTVNHTPFVCEWGWASAKMRSGTVTTVRLVWWDSLVSYPHSSGTSLVGAKVAPEAEGVRKWEGKPPPPLPQSNTTGLFSISRLV